MRDKIRNFLLFYCTENDPEPTSTQKHVSTDFVLSINTFDNALFIVLPLLEERIDLVTIHPLLVTSLCTYYKLELFQLMIIKI